MLHCSIVGGRSLLSFVRLCSSIESTAAAAAVYAAALLWCGCCSRRDDDDGGGSTTTVILLAEGGNVGCSIVGEVRWNGRTSGSRAAEMA